MPTSHQLPVTPATPDAMENLPAAPDLNLPDPDVLVNQLGMLVTAAEGENMRNEPNSSNTGKGVLSNTLSKYVAAHCWR